MRPCEKRLAVWLLADLTAFDKPTTKRGALWAAEAGSHLLEVADAPTVKAADLRILGRHVAASQGDNSALAFELMSWAVRRSYIPQLDRHDEPDAMLDLAQYALAWQRLELAQRMLRQRIALGMTPRAQRLAAKLPPDMDVR